MGKKLVPITFLLLLSLLGGVACTNYRQQDSGLAQLLPGQEGYRYVYNGFAEYGHTADLLAVEKSDGKIIYRLSGQIDDASAGEAPGPLDFALTYQIERGKLTQTVSPGARLMDRRWSKLELIRWPLRKDASWMQTATEQNGSSSKVQCTITEINGSDYRVRYQDTGSDYWEERVLRQGVGVVVVSLPFEGTTIGYSLYEAASGSANERQLNELLPPYETRMWYVGLAEYAHSGVLHPVSADNNQRQVDFVGSFEDGSGIPGTFTVRYSLDYQAGTVTERVVSNTRGDKAEINSLLHDPVILKLPLKQGATWEQPVTINGMQKVMQAEVAETGPGYHGQAQQWPIVRVKYRVAGMNGYFRDTYLEERVFQVGKGMIAFSKLLPGEIELSAQELEDERLVQEKLNQFMFGYALQPPRD